jgi:autotransporter-associated beta strand protein
MFQGTTALIKEGSGSWTLTANNTYSGTTLVNAGKLVINGDQSAAAGLVTIGPAGALGGNGVVGGNTMVNGQLSPGQSIGVLTFTGSLSLGPGSSSVFELRRNPLTNDVVHALSGIGLGGTLVVQNVGLELLQAGDRFKLFDAPAINGVFASFDFPELEAGLVWNTSRLISEGRIWVVKDTPPTIAQVSSVGGQLTITGTGGTPDWSYHVLTSTNLALPADQWSSIATNQFDAFGNFLFESTINLGSAERFYRVKLP